MTDYDFDEFFSDEPIEDVKLDPEQIKQNIPQYSSVKLCEMIVCDRYFGFDQNISTICMEELAKRRTAGDDFNFESQIEQIQKELPALDFSVPDIRNVLQRAMGKKWGGK